jgi:acetate kinase
MVSKKIKTLVINAGSSSSKFQIFDDETSIIEGMCDAVGIETSKIKIKQNGKKEVIEVLMPNHKTALKTLIDTLEARGIVFDEIDSVTHRTVHGGEVFRATTQITDAVLAKLNELIPLAPLHNPANIMCAELLMELMPNAKHFAVFDTAYHSTLPQKAYLYGVPYKYYKKHGIRKYGFHGSSHKYVIARTLEKLNNPNAKVISCHLGNGVSVCGAIAGKSIDTSMGFTPLQGSIMGTRCGLIDPAIISFLMHAENITDKTVDRILNKESGLLGLSEISSDHRIIEEKMLEGNEAAKRAHDVFCYRLTKLMGGYIAAMNGVDAIVFTGGIGENAWTVRKDILANFGYVGFIEDDAANKKNSEIITTADCKVKAFIIPTNEELQMVRDVKELLKSEA